MESSPQDALARILRYGLCLALAAPFAVIPTGLQPFVAWKAWFFFVCVALLAPLWVALCMRDRQRWPHISTLSVVVLLFTVWSIYTTITAFDPARATWSSPERMMGLVGLLHMVLFGAMAMSAFQTQGEQRLVLWWVALAGGLMGALAVLEQFIPSAFRNAADGGAWALFGNSLYLAGYLHATLLVSFVLWTRGVALQRERLLLASLQVLMLIGVGLTGARTVVVVVGLSVVVVLLFFLLHKMPQKKWHVLGVCMCILSLLLVVGATPWVQRQPIVERLMRTVSVHAGVDTRLVAWHMAAQAIRERPWVGWGMDNFYYIYNQLYDPLVFSGSEKELWMDHPHNILLGVAVSAGIPGVCLWVTISVAACVELWRQRAAGKRRTGEALLLGLFVFSYLAAHITDFETLGALSVWMLALGLCVQVPISERRHDDVPQISRSVAQIAVCGVAAVAAISIVFVVVLPAFAQVGVLDATRLLMAGQGTASLRQYNASFARATIHRSDLRAYAARQLATFAVHAPLTADERVFAFAQALGWLKSNMKDRPNDAADALAYGQIAVAGAAADPQYLDDAKLMLEAARRDAPHRESLVFTIAEIALLQDDLKLAADLLDTMHVQSDNRHYWWLKTRISWLQGNIAAADTFGIQAEYWNGFQTANELLLLADIHMAAQNTQHALLVADKLILYAPSGETYLQAARAYHMAGADDRAAAALHEASERLPDRQKEIQLLAKEWGLANW